MTGNDDPVEPRLAVGRHRDGLEFEIGPSRGPQIRPAGASSLRVVRPNLEIAIVGTYPPRRCGIATFTSDLFRAISLAGEGVVASSIALTDPGGLYDYSGDVSYEIRQDVQADYARAAEFLNHSDVRLVSIQHEYGIFGGSDGAHVLDFLSTLRVPAIVTLHTVLKNPSESQRTIVQRMARYCARLVVMSQVAADLLIGSYGVEPRLVAVIPHGIPEMERSDARSMKDALGLTAERMLLTFGLLGPSKGIETVIRALPALDAVFPGVKYFVVGATHPHILRRHGEAYRASLAEEAERLGVRDNLVFHDHFISTPELCRYLRAADVFVCPYQTEAQVTSGALSYAMGAGAAVVSTPYWYAQELLADGRGRLFPFGDSDSLSRLLLSLLEAPAELDAMRSAAYEFTRPMVWGRVGKAYFDLASMVMGEAPRGRVPVEAATRLGLPELRLDHLLRMTDDVGVIQHATYTVPARRSGYCVDDNARALIVALRANRASGSTETSRLVTTFLGYLHLAQRQDGCFSNLMRYDRTLEEDGSGDCVGRALWALGTTVLLAAEEGHRRLAREMFERALGHADALSLRGTATALMGLTSLLAAEPKASGARAAVGRLAQSLMTRYQHQASADWRWFEPQLTYDNALIPLALFQAYQLTGDRASLRVARDALDFLDGVCFEGDQLALVGNSGWYPRGGAMSRFDEQPTDAAAFVLAFRGAFATTGDRHYLRRMRSAFAWFLGENRLRVPLYDLVTAGCRDGLGETRANQNQGAESTIAFLLSLLEVLSVVEEKDGREGESSTDAN